MLLNHLHAIFREENKHAFTSYVIPPDWQGTGGWNTPSYKTSNYLVYVVNSRAVDGKTQSISNHDIYIVRPR